MITLFKAGFDVYLGCSRGTTYSRTKDGLDLTNADDYAAYFDFDLLD